MLTGNKNTDYEVLYNLDDYNLGDMCQVNQYTRELCANDVFWMNRTLRRFTPIFGTVEAIKVIKNKIISIHGESTILTWLILWKTFIRILIKI